MNKFLFFIFFIFSIPYGNCAESLNYVIKKTVSLPHDCYTQGFIIHDNHFILSCGKYGHSRLIKTDLNGKVLREKKLPTDIFAEGIGIQNNTITLLTWKQEKAFVFKIDDFQLLHITNYLGEGWGLTYFKNQFLMSNGSAELQFKNPKTMLTTSSITVVDERAKPLKNLNELEQIGNILLANVWQSTDILFIPSLNKDHVLPVARLVFLSHQETANPDDVLNGIAYDKKTDCLWLTGKNWGVAYALAVDLPIAIQEQMGVKLRCEILP